MKTALMLAALLASLTPLMAQPNVTDAEEGVQANREYVIGVDDKITINVWGERDLTVSVTVRPDGMVTMPLINDVMAAGRTPSKLRGEIAQKLAIYVREPNVSVSVDEINSFRVFILGEVSRQGDLKFTKPATLLEALALSGGLTEFASRKATVIRNSGATEQRINIDLKKLLSGEPSPDNITLFPGDVLLVK